MATPTQHAAEAASSRLRVIAIGGSVRAGNYTDRVLAALCEELRALGVATTHVRPVDWTLALPGAPGADDADAVRLRALLGEAEAVVLGTPLYNGSYSSVTKLIIDNLGYPSVLAGVPAALVGVAASPTGADRALAHLEEVCRHIRCRIIPGAVSVADVWNAFDGDALRSRQVREALRALAERIVRDVGGREGRRPAASARGGGEDV